MLLLLVQLQMTNNRVGDGWTLVYRKKRNLKSLKEKKEIGERRIFNSDKQKRCEKEGKREVFCKENKEFEEQFFQEDRSLRSGPKLLSQKKTPVFVVSSGSQPVKSGCGVSGPIFDPDVFVSGASFANGQSTLPGFENVTSMKFLEGSEEEPVLGDTPPDPSVFAGPDLHTFKDASRDAAESGNPCVCSETLGVLAPLCGEVFKPKMVSAASAGAVLVPGRAASLVPPGCARSVVPAGSGRRALRTAKRAQVSAPLECTDVVKGPDKFEQCFTPHRRVISSDSDLLALNASIPSARRVCSSSVPGGACVSVSGGACRGSSCSSRCGRASLGESGALCRVCAEGAHQSVVSSGHNSWEHGHETAGGTKVLNQCSGTTDRLSFVDTVSGGAALEQYLRGAPKGTKVEAWEGRIFTCSRPTSWDVSVAEGCKVTVSAVYLPKKRPGPPAAGPLYRILFGWSRLLYTASSGIWIFRGALRGSQVMPALASCFDWAVRGTYRTAWAVQPCCRCSYSYGNGPAVGPQVSENWEFLRGLWKAVAPLMAPWCADGEMPTCANLNLYEGSGSRVRWHSDNEGLFGRRGESKLIVSMSFGVSALFKWKPGPSPDSDASASWLHHGDLLVMDGCCQDEYLHCTDPLQSGERVNITFRWIRNHVPRCPLAAGVVCCLPTCAKGSFVYPNTEVSLPGILSVVLLVLLGVGVFLFDHPLSLLAGIALLGIALLLAFLSGAAWVW